MIDFKKIIKNSRLYNFHSHTQFCDGHAPMEEFVEEAVKKVSPIMASARILQSRLSRHVT